MSITPRLRMIAHALGTGMALTEHAMRSNGQCIAIRADREFDLTELGKSLTDTKAFTHAYDSKKSRGKHRGKHAGAFGGPRK